MPVRRVKTLLGYVKYILIGVADKVMEFNNSWEDPWTDTSGKKGTATATTSSKRSNSPKRM